MPNAALLDEDFACCFDHECCCGGGAGGVCALWGRMTSKAPFLVMMDSKLRSFSSEKSEYAFAMASNVRSTTGTVNKRIVETEQNLPWILFNGKLTL